jgi:tetratricopeptide (TPR) repeat protein
MSFAQAHHMEAQFLWADGQIDAARAALREFDSLLARYGVPDSPAIRGAGVRLSLHLARAAARADDEADCKAELQNADARFESYRATLPENSVHRHQARAVWLHGRCYVAYERRDWEELERLARELIEEVALGLVYQPDDGELLLRRATARSLLGEALLKKKDPAAALLVLRVAVSDFRDAPPALLRFTEPRDALAADAMERLAQALAAVGDVAQSRNLLESALTVRDSLLAKEPTLWKWRVELARTCAALASTLEPGNIDQAHRRRTLLDRAVGILTHPEAVSRLTASDRALLETIHVLRSADTAQSRD